MIWTKLYSTTSSNQLEQSLPEIRLRHGGCWKLWEWRFWRCEKEEDPMRLKALKTGKLKLRHLKVSLCWWIRKSETSWTYLLTYCRLKELDRSGTHIDFHDAGNGERRKEQRLGPRMCSKGWVPSSSAGLWPCVFAQLLNPITSEPHPILPWLGVLQKPWQWLRQFWLTSSYLFQSHKLAMAMENSSFPDDLPVILL
jgi:hypothetical protein